MRPPSQKNRPIGFYLTGGGGLLGGLLGNLLSTRVTLPIRPEEMTRTEPSRLQVVQTLGGSWADSWGAGVQQINLAGHCGWRGGYFIPGEDAFMALRDTVFQQWHDMRKAAAEGGMDPTAIKLIYADTLNDISVEVAPRSFTLRRSRSSPLLMRYQIQLLVVDDKASWGILDNIMRALANPLRFLAGIAGLTGVIATLDSYVRLGVNMVGAASSAVQAVLGTGAALLSAIATVAEQTRGAFDGANAAILRAGVDYSRAARNGFLALGGDETLSPEERQVMVQIGAAWTDAFCNQQNSFETGRYFRSYEDLFGASNCSSTAGGRPVSAYVANDQNSLYALTSADAAPSPVTVTAEAQQAMAELGQGDVLVLRNERDRVTTLLRTMGQGVAVA